MSTPEIVEELKKRLKDPFSKVAGWKLGSPGRKVVGCYPVYTPVELVHAAGMLPVLVAGSGGIPGIRQSEKHLQAFVCAIGRSTTELLDRGMLDVLDAMLFPSVCEISRSLNGVMSRLAGEKPFVYVQFPQNLDSAHSLDFLVCELNRVREILERLGGKPIPDDAIRASFAVYNKRAELLKALDHARMEQSPRISASRYYALRLAGMAIPPEEHIELLSRAVDALGKDDTIPSARLRMTLVGAFCERPPISIIEKFEQFGVSIVGDDMLLGQRWWTGPLPLEGDPILALAKHYLENSIETSVVHRADPKAIYSRVLREAHQREADGVIVASAKFCHPALSDIACIVKACEERSVPYIRLEFTEDMTVFAPVLLQLEALLEARTNLPFAGTENGEGRN